MSVVTEKELRNYCKHIEKSILASSKEKKEMLRGLQSGIEEYIEQHPDTTFEDIQFRFGEPTEVATKYLSDVTPKDMKQYARRKKIILCLIVGLVIVVGIFIAVYFGLVEKTPGIIKETGKFEKYSSEAIAVEQY